MECLVYTELKKQKAETRVLKKIILSVLREQKQKGSASLHLIGEKKMKNLNWRWRREKRVTDVLSFSAKEGMSTSAAKKEDDLGDIFVCLPQIKRQARELRLPYQEELKRMVIHGLLHLLGYNHKKGKEAKKMFSRQEKLVKHYRYL